MLLCVLVQQRFAFLIIQDANGVAVSHYLVKYVYGYVLRAVGCFYLGRSW